MAHWNLVTSKIPSEAAASAASRAFGVFRSGLILFLAFAFLVVARTATADPAVVTVEPVGGSALKGGSYIFTVTATGTGPLMYEWKKDGDPVSGGTGSSLVLTNVSAADAGVYNVYVSNSEGNMLSASAVLIVNEPVSIVANPVGGSILLGGSFTFNMTATGTPPITYEWHKGASVLSVGTSSSYAVSNGTLSDAGNYYAVVSNAFSSGTSSLVAALVVNEPVNIVMQPVGGLVSTGTGFTFSVSATGSAPLSYQWRLNSGSIAGGTAASLSLSPTALSDTGTYDVVVTNPAGSVTSSGTVLTVADPVNITTHPLSYTAAVGGSVTFSAAATGSAPLGYQWRKGGTPIGGATLSSYAIASVGTSNAGSYDVVVTNILGSGTSQSGTLSVFTAPVITTQPAASLATEGSPFTLSVTATGSGPLEYQWQKRSSPSGPFVAITGANASTYTIASPLLANSGTYDVVVRYAPDVIGATPVESSPAVLTVAKPVTFDILPADGVVNSGTLYTFYGKASSSVSSDGEASINSNITYQWFFNGGTISSGTAVSGGTARLTKTNVQLSDAGTYTLTARNDAGLTATTSGTLTVRTPPVITTEPQSATINVGSPHVLSVSATGTAQLLYQWYSEVDGVTNALPGETASTLTIQFNEYSTAASYYRVEVKNEVKLTSSKLAAIDLRKPPAFVQQPESTFATLGGNARFSVEATGSESFYTYQWRKDGTDIPGATTKTLSLTNVQGAAAGNYVCEVTTPNGTIASVPAALKVFQPVTIATEITGGTVVSGGSFQFNVAASAGPGDNLTYRWRRNGTPLSSGSYQFVASPGLTWHQAKADAESRGGHLATFTSASEWLAASPQLGADADKKAWIGGYRPDGAALLTGWAWVTGESFSAYSNCWASGQPDGNLVGTYSPRYLNTSGSSGRWQDSENAATGIDGYILEIESSSPSLTLSPVAAADAGNYDMVVIGPGGNLTGQSATLTVLEPPAIVTQPAPTQIAVSSGGAMTVAATGTAPLSYQWYKDDGNGVPQIYGGTGATLSFTNASLADSGSYSVVVTNQVDTVTSSKAYLEVYTPVTITSQPVSQTVNPGAPVTFSIGASGTDPLTYMWFNVKTGIVSTGSTYSISSAGSTHAGTYYVLVNNRGNLGPSATSQSFELKLNTIPKITGQPASRVVVKGQSATFKVVASGTGPLTYQWKKRPNATDPFVYLTGETSDVLTISNCQPVDEGFYAVEVNNITGQLQVSTPASLTVLEPVVITSQPASVTVGSGSILNLSVGVTGTEPISYQWYKDNQLLAGETASSLFRPLAVLGDAGTYRVDVKNEATPVLKSSNAIVTVLDSVVITSQPTSGKVGIGGSYTFSVSASGAGPISYQWRKGTTNIPGATGTSYTIASAANADAGSYEVLVWNSVSSATSTPATLSVLGPVTIDTQPLAQSLPLGSNATFSVATSGSDPRTYRWRKDGSDIPDATGSTLVLPSITGLSAGSYDVIVTNPVNSVTSVMAPLSVLLPVAIVTQPSGASVVAGNTFTTSVSVTGTAPISYQWKKGGVNVTGATGPTLTVPNVQSLDAGEYEVEVSNGINSVTSQKATLVVLQPVVITSQPVSVTTVLGGATALTVTATGSAPLTYQWRKAGVNQTGQTAPTLTFDSVLASDAGTYEVFVTNPAGGGVISAPATVTVATPPVIVTQPVGGNVISGGSLTLSVSASGTAPLTYQWKNGGTDIAGATSSSYAIVNAGTSDAGLYTVEVKNSVGSATSVQAAVVMPLPPVITTQPQPAAIPLGSNAFFFVTATGDAPLTYQWKKNGVNINGAIASSYSIVGVINADAGTYSVTVSNPGGSVDSNGALLEIVTPPAITVQPVGGNVAVGGAKSLSVTASGTAPLTYQWRLDGGTISGANASTYSIPSAQSGDAGLYDVVVSNAAGNATSEPALINVKQGVVITSHPVPASVSVGDSVDFHVTATGDGPLSYQWQKNGSDILGATGDTLSIPVVKASNAGSYKAVVRNSVSSATSSSALLDILGEPVITTHPTGGLVPKGGAYTMSVVATGAPPLSYQWYHDGTAIAGATAASYSISNAQPTADGQYRVKVSNYSGNATSNMANIVVTEMPVITTQPPATVSLVTGRTLELLVVAEGKEPLTYQWSKDGVEIPGATADMFQVVTSQESDAGTYKVVVKNSWGQTTSQSSVVTAKVKITQNPIGGTIPENSSYTLSVTATGTPNLTYQWQKNGVDIPGATNSTYQIPSAQAGDAGGYKAVVTNAAGSATSSTASVGVGASGSGGGGGGGGTAPVITAQPAIVSPIKVGQPISLDVTATGSPVLNYQWRVEGGTIASGTILATGVSSGHTIAAAQESDSGDYYVVVTNGYGTATSERVPVKVLPPVTFTLQPVDKVAAVDGSVTLTAKATGGTSPVTYQWYKGGAKINGATGASYFIPFAQKTDAGVYTVVASNAVDSQTSSPATLTVDTAVAISPQPESTTVVIGGNATFTVGATGEAPISYLWKKNGISIAGGTSATLAITNAGTVDAGTYSVVVSNNVSSLTSQPAYLRVYTPVTITTHPQNTAVNEGMNATLSVVATGSSVMTYQWSKDGVDIAEATASSYVISVAKPEDAGSYRVLVSNPAGGVSSNAATVTVRPLPRIITQPAATSVVLGGSASMSVTASGEAPLAYQWRKAGGSAIPGATNSTFSVASAADADQGQYEVVVSNAVGSTTSQTATLTVFTPLTITTQPVSQSWVAGLGGSLSVTVSGSEPVLYQWAKDGVDISGATGKSYVVVSAGTVDAGSYSVKATNPANSVTSAQALVSIKSPVVFVTQPASMGVAPGAAATFSVVATGTEVITYQWFKEGSAAPIAGATGPSYSIPAVTSTDDGRYYVVATNPVGPVKSQSAKLTVFSPPVIVVQPVDLSAKEGGSAILSVSATGTAPLNYKWRKGGTYLTGKTADTLMITNVQASDAGLYFVEVSNVLDSVSSNTVMLTVNAPLTIVTQPASVSVSSGSIASFSVSATGTTPITYEWSRNGTPVTGGTSSTLTIGSAAAADAGNYNVKLTNPAGQLVSSTAVLTLLPAIQITSQPLGGPVNEGSDYTLTVGVSGAEPLTYKWFKGNDPIPNATGNAYVVFNAKPADSGDYKVEVTNPAGSVTSIPATVAVQSPVVITKQPVGGVAATGSPFIFTVENTGSAPLTYQWFKDGLPISGGSSAAYSMSSPQILADSGTYKVVVSNLLNSATSNSVPLTVVDPVIITSQPNGNSLRVGTRSSLRVTVTGTPPLMYQWRKNGVPILDSGTIQGVTAGTLAFSSFSSGDAGNYDVVITNLAGPVQSQVASMFFMDPPVIIKDPVGGTVLQGGSFPFTVTASGSLPMFYQWKKDTLAIGTASFSSEVSVGAGSYGSPATLDGTGAAARFRTPVGVAYYQGELYIADSASHTIRKMTLAGDVSSFAGTVGVAGAVDGPAGSAQFNAPANLAADKDGNIFVADTENHVIRKISGSQVTTFAGSLGQSGAVNGMGTKARFNKPTGIATDIFGNVYVGDENHVIRKISTAGDVTSFAGVSGMPGSADGLGSVASFKSPTGLVVDSFGNTFVADSGNHAIRMITSGGSVTTIAGLPGSSGSADGYRTAARFNTPSRLTMDNAGNLFVSDTGNHTIRRIATGGSITTTVAGSPGNPGYAEGSGTLARFNTPRGIAHIGSSTFYIADSENNLVRKLVFDGSATGALDSYTVTNAAASDEGDYSVTVTNWAGSDTSNSATLKVYQEVNITAAPVGGGVVLGGSYTFSVTATGSDIAYQWYKGAEKILVGGTSASYAIPSVSAGDYGEYTVKVTNSVSPEKVASATILQVEVPTITLQPIGGIAGLGEPFVLEVEADGTAPLTYEWRRSGSLVQSGSSPIRSLSPAKATDAGDYIVTVKNPYGFAVSNAVHVSVFDFSLPLIVPVPDSNGVIYSGTQGYRGGVIIERDGSGLVNFTVPMNVPKQIIYEASVSSPFTINQSIGPSTTGIVQRSDTSALTLSSGTLTVNPSGTSLISEAQAPFTIEDIITGTGTLFTQANSSGRIDLTGAIQPNGAFINKGTGTGTLTVSGNIGDPVQSVVQNSWSSVLQLDSANSYGSPTTVSAGSLVVNADGALGSAAAGTGLEKGTTLDLRNVRYTVPEELTVKSGTVLVSSGTSSFAGTVVLSGGTGTFTIDKYRSLTIDGAMAGDGLLKKTGEGDLILKGASTLTGGIRVITGSLYGEGPGCLGSGTVSIATKGTLVLGGDEDSTVTNSISGSGTLVKAGTNTVTITGKSAFPGVVNVNSGSLVLSGEATIGSGSINVSEGAWMVFDPPPNQNGIVHDEIKLNNQIFGPVVSKNMDVKVTWGGGPGNYGGGSLGGPYATLPNNTVSGEVGRPLECWLNASNSVSRYELDWIPAGLSMDPVSGIITGTPLVPGNQSANLKLTNPRGFNVVNVNFIITIPVPGAGAPKIIDHPVNTTIVEGGTGAISATVKCATSFSYRWKYVDKETGKPSLGPISTSPAGDPAGVSVTFNPAVTGNAGDYSLLAWNSAGMVESNAASLLVTPLTPNFGSASLLRAGRYFDLSKAKPGIPIELKTVACNDYFDLKVSLPMDSKFTWQYGSSRDTTWRTLTSQTTTLLDFSDLLIPKTYSGYLRLVISIPRKPNWLMVFRISAYSGPLDGFAPLKDDLDIVQSPQNMSSTMGGDASFSVSAKGIPVRYTWYKVKEGVQTPLSDGPYPYLNLHNLQASDAGDYYVVITDLRTDQHTQESPRAHLEVLP